MAKPINSAKEGLLLGLFLGGNLLALGMSCPIRVLISWGGGGLCLAAHVVWLMMGALGCAIYIYQVHH